MALKKEEYLNQLKAIGTCTDDAERRGMIATLHDEASSLYDTNATLEESNTTLKSDMEKLRSANMELFLQVGENKTPEQIQQNQAGIVTPEEKKLTYDDLFDEKGGLK